jgi:hypothetical protein
MFVTEGGDMVIARRDAGVKIPLDEGEWLITATLNNPDLTQVQSTAWFNECGFGGRQWESRIDGQQYRTLTACMETVLAEARFTSAINREFERLGLVR